MITAWTKHLKDPEDKSRFEAQIMNSKNVLERLKELLKEEDVALRRSETDIKTFDQPNWDYRQAYKNGYRACLQMFTKLVDLDQQKQQEKIYDR